MSSVLNKDLGLLQIFMTFKKGADMQGQGQQDKKQPHLEQWKDKTKP